MKGVALGCLVSVGLLGASGASADAYPPDGVHVVAGAVSDIAVPSGAAVAFSGGGFIATSVVRLSVDGLGRGTATSDPDGRFRVRLVLSGQGPQVLAASGLASGGRLRVVSATVTVGSGSATAGLPTTGTASVLPALGLGLVSVIVGSGLVLVGHVRRRRPTTT